MTPARPRAARRRHTRSRTHARSVGEPADVHRVAPKRDAGPSCAQSALHPQTISARAGRAGLAVWLRCALAGAAFFECFLLFGASVRVIGTRNELPPSLSSQQTVYRALGHFLAHRLFVGATEHAGLDHSALASRGGER